MTSASPLDEARDRALDVRAKYEILEQRFNGKTWSLHEMMMGFSNDVGYIGRLILANDGIWDIDGDVDAELRHKLAESVWWNFVIADRLGINLGQAYTETMDNIGKALDGTIERTAPGSSPAGEPRESTS